MWRRTRAPKARGPNEAMLDSDTTRLRAWRDWLRAIRRNPEKVFAGNLQQVVELASGISKEKAKDLVKIIKDLGLKVQAQIEGEKVRVSSPKKDDLQAVMAALRKTDFPLALSFVNYR